MHQDGGLSFSLAIAIARRSLDHRADHSSKVSRSVPFLLANPRIVISVDVMKQPLYCSGRENQTKMTTTRPPISDAADDVIDAVAVIVSAFVTRNPIPASSIPELITSVHAALAGIATGSVTQPAEPAAPAISVRKSVAPSHLICLEDGQRLISMKRHLKAVHGLTPDQYRKKWGLPADYPMVAPDYSAKRAELAKRDGLGKNGNPARSKLR